MKIVFTGFNHAGYRRGLRFLACVLCGLWLALPVYANPLAQERDLSALRNQSGPDHGPLYRETNLGQFPVEPWATFSNSLFLAIVMYWALRIRHTWRQHPMLLIGLPILLLGFIGGILYHATRNSPVFLVMDWAPILILCLTTAVYLWRKLHFPLVAPAHPCAPRHSYFLYIVTALGIVVGMAAVARSLHAAGLSRDLAISAGYGFIAASVLLPLFIYTYRQRRGWTYVIAALASFAVAITFRLTDLTVNISFLPMGTHWLWHVFGALATHALIAYIYHDQADDRSAPTLRH